MLGNKRATDHAREMTPIKMRVSQIADCGNGSGDRQAVNDRPIPDRDIPTMKTDVRPATAFTPSGGELEEIRLNVAEFSHPSRRPMRHYFDLIGVKMLADRQRRLQVQPCRTQLVATIGRGSANPVDAMVKPFDRTSARESRHLLRVQTDPPGVSCRKQSPLHGREISQVKDSHITYIHNPDHIILGVITVVHPGT